MAPCIPARAESDSVRGYFTVRVARARCVLVLACVPSRLGFGPGYVAKNAGDDCDARIWWSDTQSARGTHAGAAA
jgi:hypothetical protein